MFPFLSLVVVITFVHIPSCWVIEAFYQVFPGILPQAAERYRAANRTLHKWQKTEAVGFMLGVFGDGTKEEKLCLRACLQLHALQWCWVLPTESEKEIWGTALWAPADEKQTLGAVTPHLYSRDYQACCRSDWAAQGAAADPVSANLNKLSWKLK